VARSSCCPGNGAVIVLASRKSHIELGLAHLDQMIVGDVILDQMILDRMEEIHD
jgi:hypothetical protein